MTLPPGAAVPGTTIEELRPPAGAAAPRAPGDGAAVASEPADAGEPLLEEKTELSFTLNGVDLRGATVYETSEFDDIVAEFIGKDVTLGGLREIGTRIERKYRNDGYVSARVVIPPQAIRDGKPVMQIFEGKIIHYEINGEIGEVKKHIAQLLDNLLTDKPATWTELERYMLLARDLPGISLTGTLRSAGDSAPGGIILVVDTARKAIDGFVNMQNRNADPTGPWTLTAGVSANSNTKYGERIGAVAIASVQPLEQLSGFVLYEQGIGSDGLRLKLAITQGLSEPGDDLEPLDIIAWTTLFTAQLEYPVWRGRRFSLWTKGGFEYADQRVTTNGAELYDDQMRNLFVGVDGIWFTPISSTMEFDLQFRQGLTSFGAPEFHSVTQGRSRFDARLDYTIARGSFTYTQRVKPWFEVGLSGQGQMASKPLPSLEEMSLGELTVGRGFEPGSILGDAGFGYSIEARFRPPEIDAWWLNDFQVYAFYDYGRAYDRGNPTASLTGYEEMESWGIGTRFQMFNTLFGDFYLAVPLSKALSTSEREPHPTVKFSVTKFF